ncbi:MAG: DUF1015 domain-containing protein [Planctomycetes bacterium]|nr:DUF1015 domain-containing protein [Planctomycetota bacterium]
MLRIQPFPAIRPEPHLAARVASVPYDVVNTAEARQLAEDNPLSFLHVVRPEIDLPEGTDLYDASVYAKAAENFRSLRADAMVDETEPALYLYRQVMNHRQQTGLVCCCHVDDYANNVIRRHEETRKSKEDDRTRHITALNANAGPVLLTFRDDDAVGQLIDRDRNQRPLYHFDAPDGITHTVWRVVDPGAYVTAFGDVPCAYVADGHHRSAAASRVAEQRRAERGPGPAEHDWFLSVLFPASELTILAYNRVIRSTDLDAGAIVDALGALGTLSTTDDPDPGGSDGPCAFCFYVGGAWHRLVLDPSTIDATDPVDSLDVALLHDRILEPIFGIHDVRTDSRIDFVGGIRGPEELRRQVDDGRAVVGISMRPTSSDQLLAVADAGLSMPPKSTWFEPKLRSGLFVHALD